MANDLKIQGVVEVSTEGVESALNRVGTTADGMARKIEASAATAGKAVDSIGSGAGNSANEFTRAEGKIVASIKRATTQLENLGKTASQRLELRINSQGLDAEKFAPMLAKLRELETQAATSASVANKSLNTMGVSAAQTAAALRGVPAQFTDIITSLQGGQAPLTVFLQQGGQLKDMFGGAGAAAKALGGYVAGLVSPMTIAAAAVGSYGAALYQAQQQADEFTKTLIMTGNAAGSTSAEMMAMAQGVAAATGSFSGTAAEALNKVAGSGKIAKENFELVTLAAVQMQRETGQSIDDTIKQFDALAKDPVKALLELNSKYNFLTESIYKSVKAAQDEGDAAEAAARAQRAWAETVVERTSAVEASLGRLDKGWRSVAALAASAWNAMQGGSAVDNVQRAIREQEAFIQSLKDGDQFAVGDLGKAQAYLDKLIEQRNKLTGATAEQAKETARLAAADDQWAKIVSDNLTNQQKQRKELADLAAAYTAKISAGNKTEAEQIKIAREYESAVAAINEKYKERAGAVGAAKTAESQYYATMAELHKQAAKEIEDRAKAEDAYHKALSAGSADLEKRALQLEQEAENYGLTESAIQYATIARLEEARAIAEANGAYPEHLAYLDREIEARKRLAAASASLDVKKANERAINDQAKAWENFARDIERSLTDALMRSFESGDSFGKAFAKNIQNLFKTMVLKVAIQGTANAGMSAVGLGGSSGGADLLGLAQNGSSLYSAATGGGIYGAISGFGAGAASMASEMALGSAFVGPSASLAGGAVGAGASAASATGAGSALSSVASAAPYVAAAVAAYMIADSLFGSNGGPKTEGNAYGVIGANGLDIITAADFAAPFGDGNWGRAGGQSAQMQTVVDSFGDSLANFAKTLGGDASGLGIALGFNTDPQGDAPDNIMGSVLDAAGNALYRSVYDVERGTAQQAITAESQRVMLAALQEIDLQDWADAIVDSVNPATASVEQITAALDSLTAMQTLIPVFESLGIKSENVSTAMVAAMGGFDAAAAALNSYYENFYTETERTTRLTENVTTAMENLGLAMPATRDEFRGVVESLDMTTSAGQATYAALINLAPAFVQVSDAAAQAAQIAAKAAADALAQANTLAVDAVNSAFDALANSVAAQKDALAKSHAQQMASLQAAANNATAALNTLSSLAETLKVASASLNASDADRLAARQSAMATLDAAYATAQTGGSLAPLTDGIKSAISELQKPSEDLYSSFTEYMVAQARYGSIITSLAPYAEGQKSAAQMTLDAVNASMSDAESSYQAQVDSLDSLVTSAASQVNLLKGIDDSVKSVKSAIDALHSTVRGAALTGIQAGTTTPTAAAEIIKNTGVDLVSESWNQVQTANGTQDIYLSSGGAIGLDGRIYSIAGTSMAAGDVVAWINAKVAQGDASGTEEGRRAAYMEIYNAAVSNGVSAASLDKLMGLSPGTANQIAAMLGMPAFARGGLASGWSLVGEEGPELVNFTNPARVYTASQTADALGGAGSEEIRALRADQQAQSAAFAALMARVTRVLEKWDGDGIPESRVTV